MFCYVLPSIYILIAKQRKHNNVNVGAFSERERECEQEEFKKSAENLECRRRPRIVCVCTMLFSS